ncbi:MAG: glutamate-5-semialdehyde dehydrogenase [Actinomycetota bacterium]|nr:glutamate-5-semialdehyde dehydrogenase [Actinomycetota bacterium]
MGVDSVGSVEEIARRAKAASRVLATLPTGIKNGALKAMAQALPAHLPEILAANAQDMQAARAKGISDSLLDRLMLDEARVGAMSEALMEVAALPDPIGEVVKGWKVPNGLLINQVRVPMGVVGVVYEARPNVTVDATALAIKAGNAVILRGGSLAMASNLALTKIISEAAEKAGAPPASIQALPTADRESVDQLMKLDRYIDLLVPRGGKDLIKNVVANSTVPVLWAGAGNCHIYVHADADFDMAEEITINAKVQRPSVCNAAETLLVHRDLAGSLLPRLVSSLQAHGVTVHGCPTTQALPGVIPAVEEDWYTEYLGLEIAVKVVDSLGEAIDHINKYGTLHSEAIITKDYEAAKTFMAQIDSAAVYVNASTRFTDGAEFGMGAEIGISTQKLHARGPMGLTALTSKKYVIFGSGQVR